MGTAFPDIVIGTRVEKENGSRAFDTGEIVALEGDDAIVHWHSGELTGTDGAGCSARPCRGQQGTVNPAGPGRVFDGESGNDIRVR